MDVKENSAKPGKKLWITPWLIVFGIFFVLISASFLLEGASGSGVWFLLVSAIGACLLYLTADYSNHRVVFDVFLLQQKIERWVEQTEWYKNLENLVGIPANKPQAFQSSHKPQGFFSQLFATAFGIVFGVIILLVLGIWPLSLMAPPAGTPIQGNTINTQTENAQGVVDAVNRLYTEYQDKLNLVDEIQKRTDALGTSANKGMYVEWKLRNTEVIDAGERLATYITEHFKELDAKRASDILSGIATNKERMRSDNKNLEQTIAAFDAGTPVNYDWLWNLIKNTPTPVPTPPKLWSVSYASPEIEVRSLIVYNGTLYAGTGRSGVIYIYDGNSWRMAFDSPETEILSFAVYNNKLYAGAGGKIYVYDGASWSMDYDSPGSTIFSLAVYDGKLYAGTGNNGVIYVYDGKSWGVSYDSVEYYIYSLVVYDNRLYAGTGNNGRVYMYDGSSWSANYSLPDLDVTSLAVYNNKLYAGTNPKGLIYAYDGTSWKESYDTAADRINALAVYANKLYAVTSPQMLFYVYDGVSWNRYDFSESNSNIYALAVYDGKLYAGTGPSGRIYVYYVI